MSQLLIILTAVVAVVFAVAVPAVNTLHAMGGAL